MKSKLLAVAAVFLALATPSHADVFTLDRDLCPGDCGFPAGTVTLTQNGTAVDAFVQVHSGFRYKQTGYTSPANEFQVFRFNGVDVVLSDITVTSNTNPNLQVASGTFSGVSGDFGFGVNNSGDFDGNFLLHIVNATIADLTWGNNLGYAFAANVLAPNGNIGEVAAMGNTPLPAALPLFVTGLGALGLLGWRRKRKVV